MILLEWLVLAVGNLEEFLLVKFNKKIIWSKSLPDSEATQSHSSKSLRPSFDSQFCLRLDFVLTTRPTELRKHLKLGLKILNMFFSYKRAV